MDVGEHVGRGLVGSGVDDGELLRRVATSNDGDALGEFYDRHHDRVMAFFFSRTLSHEVSSDLAAETFACVLKDAHRFNPTAGAAGAWLQGIARHQLHQYFRRGRVQTAAQKRLRIDPASIESDYERVETLLDADMLRSRVAVALRNLRPKLRDAVVLRVIHEEPYERVAAELGITVGAARVRVLRGLRHLGEQLDEEASE